MPPYLRLGSIPRKRHIAHRHEPGFRGEGIYYEEVVTAAGFQRAYSIAYHLRPPTRVRKVEPAGSLAMEIAEEPTLRHHHLRSGARHYRRRDQGSCPPQPVGKLHHLPGLARPL